MTTDFRALCAELLDELEYQTDWSTAESLKAEARAALVELGPEGPTDEELESVARAAEIQNMKEQGGLTANGANGVAAQLQLQRLAGLRAVLARWSRPAPQPPAEGEVEELVARLSAIRNDYGLRHSADCQRAADLLHRLSPPQPVPVSERLPGPEDMTDDGEVWIENPGHEYSLADAGDYGWDPHKWILRPIGKFDAQNGLRWLPAHALPIPQQQQENAND